MKFILVAIMLIVPVLAAAAPAADPKTQCLYVPDIGPSERPDDNTILFHMRNHAVYRVTMQTRCFGLKNEPDGYTFGPDDLNTENVCANQATIRLNSFRSICQLGDFTRIK